MDKETYLLKYTDIPFAFAIISIVTGISWSDLSSIPILLLYGGTLSTLLEILDIPKFLFWIYLRYFTYIKNGVFWVETEHNNEQINAANQIYNFPKQNIPLIKVAKKAYNLQPLLKTKEKLVSMLYLILLLAGISLFGKSSFAFFASKINFTSDLIIFQLFIGLLIIPVLIKFLFELNRLPLKIVLLCYYILEEQGVVSLATVPDYEKALMDEDWTIAQSISQNPRLAQRIQLIIPKK